MTLTSGSRLGPYEIVSAVGAGGMGEVYKARDTRLDRTVAIKVLPAHVASDPDVRQRFEREARAVAALNHPHICTLHDIGTQDGTDFLVMEYLEGETLADRLTKSALPLDQALRYGIEIADALDKAHRAGIIHRDLKPGNIMLTKGGAKLLDFGLAKTGAATVAGTGLSMLPTTPPNLTARGTILGTFQYMAPEQLEGLEADIRTDIFAFGAVLYEMLTGKKAFEGKSQASLIAAILDRDPPPISTVQPVTPRALDRMVSTCLAKDKDDRWQSSRDLLRELKWIAEGTSSASANAAARLPPWRHSLVLLALGLTLGGILAGAGVWLAVRPARIETATSRFVMPAPEKVTFGTSTNSMSQALSRDGRYLVFVGSNADGTSRLWLRPLDSLTARVLPGTEGASSPFWSPDNRSVGFFSGGKLKKIDMSGGPAQTLADAPSQVGGTWNPDGVILFAPSAADALYRVSSGGGAAMPVTDLDESLREVRHAWPFFLPDGRHFLFLGACSPWPRRRSIRS
jgi:serine/threonine protein kinase